jgi:hypothetical protein
MVSMILRMNSNYFRKELKPTDPCTDDTLFSLWQNINFMLSRRHSDSEGWIAYSLQVHLSTWCYTCNFLLRSESLRLKSWSSSFWMSFNTNYRFKAQCNYMHRLPYIQDLCISYDYENNILFIEKAFTSWFFLRGNDYISKYPWASASEGC